MNNTTLVIENALTDFAAGLQVAKLEFNNLVKDKEIDEWLLLHEAAFEGVEKIIIPCRLGEEDSEYIGLYVGLHIRLSRKLGKVRYLPILFVSEEERQDVLQDQLKENKLKSALLLFTKGSYLLSAFQLEEYIDRQLDKIDDKILKEQILPHLQITETRDAGHQLANECFY